MGTNYYLHREPCPHCGRGDEPVHIGKSSCGWCFSLAVYPEDGINDLADWMPLFENAIIRDECNTVVTADEMRREITERSHRGKPLSRLWCEENEAVPGPHGLARHRIDGYHCIRHGNGTYDLCRGGFS